MNHRKSLNTDQLKVLELLYKFRFGSNDLFAKYFGKRDRSFVYKRLQILLEQGLIGKRFDGSYRLRGKPVAYYLLPDGVRALQEARPGMAINIKMIYKSKSVSEEFVEYCLALFGIYCRMREPYGDGLHFFTKNQLVNRYEYFSKFVPSAYIRIAIDDTEKDYFLEYLQTSKPLFAAAQRLKQYIEYADSGEWEAGTDSDFPKVLLICDKASLQDHLIKRAQYILGEADESPQFYITAQITEGWMNLVEPENVLTRL